MKWLTNDSEEESYYKESDNESNNQEVEQPVYDQMRIIRQNENLNKVHLD